MGKIWKTYKSSFLLLASMIIGGIVTGAIMVTAATVMLGMPVRNAMDMSIQLEPTLGTFAKPFMAIGLVAAGVSSAVCTPMGVSYVLAGLFGWETNRSDKRYTITNFLVLLTGIIIAGAGFNPIALIMAAQMVNGVVLPVVVGVTIYLTASRKIMGQFANSTLENVLGGAIFIISLILGVSSVISLL